MAKTRKLSDLTTQETDAFVTDEDFKHELSDEDEDEKSVLPQSPSVHPKISASRTPQCVCHKTCPCFEPDIHNVYRRENQTGTPECHSKQDVRTKAP